MHVGRLRTEGNATVLLGACDTFRAAAVEQLGEWARRANVSIEVPTAEERGGDPVPVVRRSIRRAVAEKFDFVIIDTSGRLSNNFELIEQLQNMKAAIQKELPQVIYIYIYIYIYRERGGTRYQVVVLYPSIYHSTDDIVPVPQHNTTHIYCAYVFIYVGTYMLLPPDPGSSRDAAGGGWECGAQRCGSSQRLAQVRGSEWTGHHQTGWHR